MNEDQSAPDDDEFIALGGAPMTREAFQLHGFAMVQSLSQQPGFVSDEWLNSIPAETTAQALELELLGRWVREDGGYRIIDEMLAGLVAYDDQMTASMAECKAAGHHTRGVEFPDLCTVCQAPIDADGLSKRDRMEL